LTIEQALDLSVERLLATAAARRRQRAAELLVLVQAPQANAESWVELQQKLLNQIKS
jgi:hypothetical protein